MEQLNIFDALNIMQTGFNIPVCNEKGYIPADHLIPIKQESWTFHKKDWTLRGGEPYIIHSTVAILPGNRLYYKKWVEYPFMVELPNAKAVDELYYTIRQEIKEKAYHDNELQHTYTSKAMLPLEDMWQYEDGKYSCEQYAKTRLYGYSL